MDLQIFPIFHKLMYLIDQTHLNFLFLFKYSLNKRSEPGEHVGIENTNLGIQYGFHITKEFANMPGVQNLLNPIKNFEMTDDDIYPRGFDMEQIIPLLFTKIKEIEKRLDNAGIPI